MQEAERRFFARCERDGILQRAAGPGRTVLDLSRGRKRPGAQQDRDVLAARRIAQRAEARRRLQREQDGPAAIDAHVAIFQPEFLDRAAGGAKRPDDEIEGEGLRSRAGIFELDLEVILDVAGGCVAIAEQARPDLDGAGCPSRMQHGDRSVVKRPAQFLERHFLRRMQLPGDTQPGRDAIAAVAG